VKLPPLVLHTLQDWLLVFGPLQMKFESSGNNLVVGVQQVRQNNELLATQVGIKLLSEP
jgi:hypothetical protein